MVFDKQRLPGVRPSARVSMADIAGRREGGRLCASPGPESTSALPARPIRGTRNARHMDLSGVLTRSPFPGSALWDQASPWCGMGAAPHRSMAPARGARRRCWPPTDRHRMRPRPKGSPTRRQDPDGGPSGPAPCRLARPSAPATRSPARIRGQDRTRRSDHGATTVDAVTKPGRQALRRALSGTNGDPASHFRVAAPSFRPRRDRDAVPPHAVRRVGTRDAT